MAKKKNQKNRLKEEKELKQETEEQAEEVNMVREIIGTVLYIAFVIFAVWFIITYVGQRTIVDGQSMYSTLEDRDNLWVSKISYHIHEPERFDIVVFPHDEGDEKDVYYIKRIIGMPGEKVRIDEEGTIYINDHPLEENYGYETISPNRIGRAYENVVLGDDEYFVMGDNRNNSEDSRFEEVGNLSRDELIGKAVFRLWPFSKFGKIE